MMDNCIICNQKYKVGEIAPENWVICIDCVNQGYWICEADNKIFNKRERSDNNFMIQNPQTFIIGNYDLLENVRENFEYLKYENKVCNNTCYNMLYLDKCIEELESYRFSDFVEKTIPLPVDKEKRNKFMSELENKINQLKECKAELTNK